MTAPQIIDEFTRRGVSIELGISCSPLEAYMEYEYSGGKSPEIESLLSCLAERRDEAIDYLMAGRFVTLPDDIAIPAEWSMSGKMKRYVLDAPEQILKAIQDRHSPLFMLLWTLKALCFVKGGKTQYERLETALRDVYGFDYAQYESDWRRYVELLDAKPDEIRAKADEFTDVQSRLRESGAKI